MFHVKHGRFNFWGITMRVGLETRETIFALASGGGKAAIAVVRISGPKAGHILQVVTRRTVEPRVAVLAAVCDPETGETIDRGIVLWFPAPNSFTGEDSVEFQIHGSRAVRSAMFHILAGMPGVRLAQPGEFARRALENGKLDLIGVEALADLIDAETEQQRRLAAAQASGAMQVFVERLRAEMIELMAIIETELDFVDEEDRPENVQDRVKLGLAEISRQLVKAGANYRFVERVREGLTVLIAGPPNAGKSSLLNAMARRDVAIVSEYAGTTRDLIEVRLDLDGFPINVIDTAGYRLSDDPIEQEGIRRALAKSTCADLVLWLSSIGAMPAEAPEILRERPLWKITTKADLVESPEASSLDRVNGLEISVFTGQNLDILIDRLKGFAKEHMTFEGQVLIANERQRFAVNSALEAIEDAKQEGLPLEIVAEDLRRACFALESFIGKVGVEDVLDALFARFCIGK